MPACLGFCVTVYVDRLAAKLQKVTVPRVGFAVGFSTSVADQIRLMPGGRHSAQILYQPAVCAGCAVCAAGNRSCMGGKRAANTRSEMKLKYEGKDFFWWWCPTILWE